MSHPQTNNNFQVITTTRRASTDCVGRSQVAVLPMSSSNPDLLSHPPITSQPSVSPSGTNNPAWTYTPSGPLPMERPDYYASTTNINAHKVANGKQEVRGQTEITSPSEVPSHQTVVPSSSVPSAGSRDWSRGLFGAFQDFQKSRDKWSALKMFIHECCCVPCMMCSVAKSLGDKSYLPFIPGTGAAIRFKVRILGGIEGSIADDCLMTSCCCPCAVCQMHREIDDIGLAPT